MLFCAGLGTRLRPLTDHIPKPAIPFLGRPLVAHTLDWLRAAGVERVVVNLHHLPQLMRETVLAAASSLEVVFSEEPELLGTGGGLVAARPLFRGDGPILVVNGDCYYHAPLAPLFESYVAGVADRAGSGGPGGATLASLWISPDPRYGDIANVRSVDGGIVSIAGRPARSGRPALGDTQVSGAYLGVQLISQRLLDRLPPSGPSCLRDDGWIPALADGELLRAVDLGGHAFDLGTPERYMEAHEQQAGGTAIEPAVARWLRPRAP